VPEAGASPSQTSGPLWGFALLFDGSENGVNPASPGAIELRGRVLDGDGRPVGWPDALIEIWHGDQLARTRTDAEGLYRAVVAKPEPQTAPDGTPLAPHLNVSLFARGLLKQLVTRIYFPDETAANAADPALGHVPPESRATLIARPDGDGLRFDLILQGEGETAFFQF
jgi:protocatechuate 3,4-dioxygenase alpha subunit